MAVGGSPAKRQSTSAIGGTPKKVKASAAAACSKVSDAVHKAGSTWMGSKDNLHSAVLNSLGVAKSERHANQQRMVDIIGTALEDHRATLAAKVAETEGPVQRAAQTKEEREQALEAATVALTALDGAVEEQKNVLAIATSEENTMKKRVEQKLDAEKVGVKMLNSIGEMKSKFETIRAALELGESGRISGHSPAVKVPRTFAGLGRELGIEMEMMNVLPGALAKEPEKRSEFERFTVESFGTTIAKLQEVYGEQQHAAQEADNKERAQALSSAQDDLAKASDNTAQQRGALAEAKAAAKAGKHQVEEAQKAVNNYNKDMKSVMDKYDQAKAELAVFTNNPLAAFESLNAE
jgi:chromosome segregation ATPase